MNEIMQLIDYHAELMIKASVEKSKFSKESFLREAKSIKEKIELKIRGLENAAIVSWVKLKENDFLFRR